ncbi:MAG: hypothetical protein AAF621_03065, partial [Pseudomonadota bacterium]
NKKIERINMSLNLAKGVGNGPQTGKCRSRSPSPSFSSERSPLRRRVGSANSANIANAEASDVSLGPPDADWSDLAELPNIASIESIYTNPNEFYRKDGKLSIEEVYKNAVEKAKEINSDDDLEIFLYAGGDCGVGIARAIILENLLSDGEAQVTEYLKSDACKTHIEQKRNECNIGPHKGAWDGFKEEVKEFYDNNKKLFLFKQELPNDLKQFDNNHNGLFNYKKIYDFVARVAPTIDSEEKLQAFSEHFQVNPELNYAMRLAFTMYIRDSCKNNNHLNDYLGGVFKKVIDRNKLHSNIRVLSKRVEDTLKTILMSNFTSIDDSTKDAIRKSLNNWAKARAETAK